MKHYLLLLLLISSSLQAQWLNKGPGTNSLLSVYFFDANLGYTCGAGGSLYRTRDGGTTWQLLPNFYNGSVTNRIRSVALPLATTVIVVWETPKAAKPTTTYISTDNGNTFQMQDNGNYNLISMRPTTLSLLVGDAGTLRYSRMGGYNWVTLNGGTLSNLRDGDCPTGTDCYIVGDGGTVRRSTNGNLDSWQALNSTVTSRLNGVWFTDAQHGYSVGDGGVGIRTSNGGNTWTRMPMGTSVNLNDVRFVSPTVGFAIGDFGTVLLTTDSGATWQAETTNTFETLFSISATDDGNSVWVSGDAGTVLKRGPVVLAAGSAVTQGNWQAYPNPFSSSITVQLPQRQGQEWELTLLDNLGRTVAQQHGAAAGSKVTLEFPVEDVKPGLYWMRLKMGSLVETKRLVRLP